MHNYSEITSCHKILLINVRFQENDFRALFREWRKERVFASSFILNAPVVLSSSNLLREFQGEDGSWRIYLTFWTKSRTVVKGAPATPALSSSIYRTDLKEMEIYRYYEMFVTKIHCTNIDWDVVRRLKLCLV
jgi:hypothetical protein